MRIPTDPLDRELFYLDLIQKFLVSREERKVDNASLRSWYLFGNGPDEAPANFCSRIVCSASLQTPRKSGSSRYLLQESKLSPINIHMLVSVITLARATLVFVMLPWNAKAFSS